MSFNCQKSEKRTIVGALTDRVMLATKNRFIIRAAPLLEPLLLGYFSTISASKLKTELNVELVMRACKFVDTNQISSKLTKKLQNLGLFNS